MLEDESGRVRLVGQIMEDRKYPLVTGEPSSGNHVVSWTQG